jgi:ubiquinone/menaquinone biosynthesis C-methylase UbiE
MTKQHPKHPAGWDALAHWYDGWMGSAGSDHHRKLAIPAVLDLLDLQPDEHVLDMGAGQGVLAPYVARTGACYRGIDISPHLLALAQQRHGTKGQFLRGDARYLGDVPSLHSAQFDAVVFLLSIQDMNPLERALESAAWVLRPGGRVVMLMTHPCFRVPRQSGWEHDDQRNLRFRRIDRYLTPLAVPMKPYGKERRGVSISFHRPLSHYVNGLAACGLYVDKLHEITTYENGTTRAEQRANAEIPLFVGLRARKV